MTNYNAKQIPFWGEDFPPAINCPGKPACPRRDFPADFSPQKRGYVHVCIHSDCDNFRNDFIIEQRRVRREKSEMRRRNTKNGV